MKIVRSILTILLLLFVATTVGTLIAQEVSRSNPQPMDSSISGPVDTQAEEPDLESAGAVYAEAGSDVDQPEIDYAIPATVDDASADDEPIDASPLSSSDVAPPCVIEAVYFHNTHRCYTCLKIESDAKAIAEEIYADEFASGTLVWSAINMEEDRSAIAAYDLTSPSLVLIRKSGDEVLDWVLLEQTWSLVRSTTRFSAYIIDSFESFLGGCL